MSRFLLAALLFSLSFPVFARDVTSSLERIVETNRAMILLVEQSDSEDPLATDIFAARNAYTIKREHVEKLVELAISQSDKNDKQKLTATSRQFIRFLNSSDELRDADWLAFNDLIDELVSIESARGLPASKLKALTDISERHQAVMDYYREQYGKVLQKMRAGEPQFQRWGDYLQYLQSRYDHKALSTEYGRDNARLYRYATRGEEKATEKDDSNTSDAPRIIWGNKLPDKTVVLTFDDGPHRRNTGKILDTLKQYQVSAYFFSVGNNLGKVNNDAASLGRNKNIAKRIIDEGHILANHSYTHAILTKLPPDKRIEEMTKTNLLISMVTGSQNSLFRPPYGSKDKTLEKQTQEQGMASVMWNIDSMDWADPIPESIVDRTMKELNKHDKGILLFHDIHKQTVEALPELLDTLAEQGYRVVTLSGEAFESNITGVPQPPKAEAKKLYRQSWAVVIGINNYQHWPRLEYAASDAKSIASALHEKLGFPTDNIITLIDEEATSQRINEALGYTLADPEKVHKNDRVFVFFAGHGMTRQMPNGKALGYIIPVDAEVDGFQRQAISMTQLAEFNAFIPAKHVYYIMDSCYSGLALTRAGINTGHSSAYIKQVTSRKSRQILTAGGADEQVADGGPGGHSIFTWTLLQALDGLADSDNNGYITASELGTYVSPVVSSYSSQTPAFGNLLGSEGGDFVFSIDPDALEQVSQRLAEDEKRIKNELDTLRENTTASVKRRLELELSLEQEKAGEPDKLASNTRSRSADDKGERIKQAKRLNASAIEYIKEKRLKLARDELAEAVRLNPYNPTIVNNYGYVLQLMGNLDQALKWYYRTVELAPRRTAVYFNLGEIMAELDRYQESAAYYERYLHLYPSYKNADNIRNKIEKYRNIEEPAT